jgi:hypothetical protein
MILIGATDIGPARYLLALDRYLAKPNLWIGSELSQPLLAQYGHRSQQRWQENLKAELVLTGTANGPCLDKDLINWAIERGVPSVSVIEHWSWYRRRYQVDEMLVLPDYIIVNDQIANDQAVAEGLPVERLFVGGNPWLEHLSTEVSPAFDICSWRDRLGLPQGRIIVFVAEALRDDFPKSSADYLGYDEFEVLKTLIDIASKDAIVVIKRHPEEPSDKYTTLLSPGKVYSIGHASLFELAKGADFIVGMASMLLIELAMLRDDVISYRPNARLPFIGNTLGATIQVNDRESLSKLFLLRNTSQIKDTSFRNRFQGSGDRIGKFLGDLMA